MLTKPQAFYDNPHKQALGYQNLFYLKKAQRKRMKPSLDDGVEVFQNDDSYVSQNVVKIPEYFEINDLKARLQDKDTTICIFTSSATTYCSQACSSLNIRTVAILVEQAKAKQPLDSELDFACKYATRIQELLVYVQDTCPNAIIPSAKKVTVKPMNNVKKVRFAKPLISSSNIKQLESSNTSDSNTHVLSSTGVEVFLLVNCGSKSG
ncbi:hypothetical protein Tco_1407625 [Tanacetum coccineum]